MLRKPSLIISLITVVCLAFVSCDNDPINPNNPVEPLLEIQNEIPRLSPSAGSLELIFDSNLPWNITLEPAEGSSEGWYFVSADLGAAGDNISVTITAEPNDTYEDRGFTLTLSNDALQKQVTITQSYNLKISYRGKTAVATNNNY